MDKHEAEFQRFLQKLDFEQGRWDGDMDREQELDRLRKQTPSQASSPLQGSEADKIRRKLNGGH